MVRGCSYAGEMHLTPLHSVLQLRPSMQHVDLRAQAEENERRRERGVPVSDDEDAAPAAAARDARRAGVIPLNVSVRNDGAAHGGYGQAVPRLVQAGSHEVLSAQRDAEAERWVDLQWVDEHTPEHRAWAHDQLVAKARAPLYSTTSARDFL